MKRKLAKIDGVWMMPFTEREAKALLTIDPWRPLEVEVVVQFVEARLLVTPAPAGDADVSEVVMAHGNIIQSMGYVHAKVDERE